MRTRRSDSPKVVIVGPCASGKSSLAAALRDRGIDARVVAQEHSIIRDLWHRQDPDLLIALDVNLETLRARRSPTWLASVYESQRARLTPAFMAADLVLDTSPLPLDAVIATVLAWLEGEVADSGGDEEDGGAAIS